MMLIIIIYLACAAFVLIHLATAPHLDDEELPEEPVADAIEPPGGDASIAPRDEKRIGDGRKRVLRMAIPLPGLRLSSNHTAPS